MMKPFLFAGLLGFGLTACTSAQISQATAVAASVGAAVQAACTDYAATATQVQGQVKGGAANTVATLVSYGDSVCKTATTIAAAANNPGTAAWVGMINGEIQAVANPPAAAPAPAKAS